jgi:hypothetical protein
MHVCTYAPVLSDPSPSSRVTRRDSTPRLQRVKSTLGASFQIIPVRISIFNADQPECRTATHCKSSRSVVHHILWYTIGLRIATPPLYSKIIVRLQHRVLLALTSNPTSGSILSTVRRLNFKLSSTLDSGPLAHSAPLNFILRD